MYELKMDSFAYFFHLEEEEFTFSKGSLPSIWYVTLDGLGGQDYLLFIY